jgi:desulfoferrodoxin-like iron-binding protein
VKDKGGENVTEEGQKYVCEICGNKVQVLEAGAGILVCCGQNMTLVE